MLNFCDELIDKQALDRVALSDVDTAICLAQEACVRAVRDECRVVVFGDFNSGEYECLIVSVSLTYH